jgi:hypothetical protein
MSTSTDTKAPADLSKTSGTSPPTRQAASLQEFIASLPIPPHIQNAPAVGVDPETGEESIMWPVDFLGRPMLTKLSRRMAAYFEHGKNYRSSQRALNRHKMISASERYREKPTATNRKKLLGVISNYVGFCDSHERAELMMEAIMFEPSEIFWRVIIDNWSACDASYHVAGVLLRLMRIHGRHDRRKWMNAKQREIYDALPDLVEVWRGTDRSRVRSIAWSTSRKVAAGFATGMRGGAFPDPVIAHAFIPKEHIFWADEGGEQEIVLDPKRLRKLTVDNFDGAHDLKPYFVEETESA